MAKRGIQDVDEEIQQAAERQRHQWMRRRLDAYCLFMIGVALLEMVVHLIMAVGGAAMGSYCMRAILRGGLHMAVFWIGLLWARRRTLDEEDVVRYGFRLVVSAGVLAMIVAPIVLGQPLGSVIAFHRPAHLDAPTLSGRILLVHLVASLFLPWSVREGARALAGLWVTAAVALVLFRASPWDMLIWPFAGLPGLLVCAVRTKRFRYRFALDHLSGRYRQMKQELAHARHIHELLFPEEIAAGPFHLRYCYEPTEHIGGDYLYVRQDRADRLNVVVLDVTGHGITAALTVNRIYGELDRLFGERQDRAPGELIVALNRYFSVSIARHGIFATALALRVDASQGSLEWANAGHPPAFLVSQDGVVQPLESNAVMLGVVDDPEYSCPTEQAIFAPGDRVVLYTDGVIEALDGRERALGVEGVRDTLRRAHGDRHEDFLQMVWQRVQDHRQGPATDDTLVVEITRR